jgi:anti-anti-sigma factor
MAKDFIKLSVAQSVHVIELNLPEMLDSEEFNHLNTSMLKSLDGKTSGNWIVDVSSVDYMGSSVLGLMINIRQQIKSGGGKLMLAGLSPQLRDIFKTCCLESLFQIAKTRADAIRTLADR